MTVKDIKDKLNLTVFCGEEGLSREVTGGYASDLLSDVMGNADAGQVWLTLQTHKNVMAIASLKDLAAIVLVNNNKPDNDTIDQSKEEAIPVLGSYLGTFELAARIYEIIKQ